MDDKIVRNLLKNRYKIAKQMPRSSKIVKGTLVELRRKCGKPNCRCQKGEKHVSLYLSQSHKGKTRMTYIPRKYEKEIKTSVKWHKKLIQVVEDLSEINIKIIKSKG